MKDASVEKEKIAVDYTQANLPDSVKNFMPEVYRDGDRFVSVLGSAPNAITAEGSTVEEALGSWDEAYQAKKNVR